jgi:hypothetical protein
MTFHADYWVAVAAAAPVIALATVVAYGETLNPMATFRRSTRYVHRRGYRMTRRLTALLTVIMILQAGTLFDALQSLAADHNASPIWFATLAETFGLVALFGITGFGAVLRMWAAQADNDGRPERPGRESAGA